MVTSSPFKDFLTDINQLPNQRYDATDAVITINWC